MTHRIRRDFVDFVTPVADRCGYASCTRAGASSKQTHVHYDLYCGSCDALVHVNIMGCTAYDLSEPIIEQVTLPGPCGSCRGRQPQNTRIQSRLTFLSNYSSRSGTPRSYPHTRGVVQGGSEENGAEDATNDQ